MSSIPSSPNPPGSKALSWITLPAQAVSVASLAAERLVTAETGEPSSSPHFSFLLFLVLATRFSFFLRFARHQLIEFISA